MRTIRFFWEKSFLIAAKFAKAAKIGQQHQKCAASGEACRIHQRVRSTEDPGTMVTLLVNN